MIANNKTRKIIAPKKRVQILCTQNIAINANVDS